MKPVIYSIPLTVLEWNLITINRSIISTFGCGKRFKANDVDSGNRALHLNHAGGNYRE